MVVEMPHCLGGAGASPKDNTEMANVDAPIISLGFVVRWVRYDRCERNKCIEGRGFRVQYDVEVHMPSDRADPHHVNLMCSTSRSELKTKYMI